MGPPSTNQCVGTPGEGRPKSLLSYRQSSKFADSRSFSWEYNPTTSPKSPTPGTALPVSNRGLDNTKTQRDCDNPNTNQYMEASTNISDSNNLERAVPKSPSPDIIASSTEHQQDFTNSVGASISKSSSLTSLQQGTNSGSPQKRPTQTNSLRRSSSSQSLNLPLQGPGGFRSSTRSMEGSLGRGGVGGAGRISLRGTHSPRIMTGTMEAISNMIISRSGVSPKSSSNLYQSCSSLLAQHSSDGSPHSLNSVTNIRAMPDVKSGGKVSLDEPTIHNPNNANSPMPRTTQNHSEDPQIISVPTIDRETQKDDEKTRGLNNENSLKKSELTKSNVMTSQVDSLMIKTLAGTGMTAQTASIMCLTGAKGYIMDKYFEEIAKSWDEPDEGSTDGPPDVAACGREFSTLSHQRAVVKPMVCGCGRERSEMGEGVNGAEDSVSLQDHAHCCNHPPKKDIRNSYGSSNLRMYSQVEDLIHLEEPLTEEALIKTLQARFYSGHYYTNIGPVLVLVNPLTFIPEPRPLGGSHTAPSTRGHLQRLVQDATRHQLDSGVSQTLLLNGVSGSGKTHSCMLLLRQLFDIAGGGSETDAFKHLRAAMTVLRSLGSAATSQNNHASRMGYMIENNIADGAIYRTKIHCYFIDQTRVVKPQNTEKNFHIFYQMLAGLSVDERAKYHLTGQSSHTLNYLCSGDVTQDDVRDREHFLAWKNALAVLGIPFMDIMRVLAAIMLLGNIEFHEGAGLELEVQGENELQAVSALLGVTRDTMYRGLCTRTRRARGQVFKAQADAYTANYARDCLAKALYCRLVAAIIKRANNTKRLMINCANSTDSNDSGHNEGSQQDMPLSRGNPFRGSGSCTSPHQSDSFIGVLDMFGFEQLQENHFEQLCVNLCAETLQHFYNTHMFRAAEEACAEEAITSDIDITYTDNAPTIELLSSPRIGILSLLDAECGLQRGCPETLLQKVHIQHSRNNLFFEPSYQNNHMFGIKHFSGPVTYDARSLLSGNRNQLPDDIIATFTKQTCSFGFASHLFSQEIKAIQDDGGGPRGSVYRISPSPMVEKLSDLRGSLSSDFHLKLDSILQLLVSSRPHFVRCIKSNDNMQRELFEREFVKKQIRSLQLLETLHLMAAGFPHRWRYRAFNNRYQCLIQSEINNLEKHYEESNLIFDKLLKTLDELKIPSTNAHWALGKKHIFLSEGCRQLLEELRDRKRHTSATVIQANWRMCACKKKWPALKRQLVLRKRERHSIRKHVKRNSMLDGNGLQQIYNGHDPIYGSGSFDNGTHPMVPQQHDMDNNRAMYNNQQQNDVYYHHVPQRQQPPPQQQQQPAPVRRRHASQDGATSDYSSVHFRQSSADNGTRNTQNQPGPGRYSFHGNPRQSRHATMVAPSQKPRSRSTERHYVSHDEYQRQLSRQRNNLYSSHNDLRIGMTNNNIHPVQYRQQNVPGSRHSQSSHASSGSGPHVQPGNGTVHLPHSTQSHPPTPTQHNPSHNNNNLYTSHKDIRPLPNQLTNGLREPTNPAHHPQPKLTNGYPNGVSIQMPDQRPKTNGEIERGPYDNQMNQPSSVLRNQTSSAQRTRTSSLSGPTGSSPSSDHQGHHVTFQTPTEQPPPVPASRTYTVKGNVKLGYPQIRVMKQTYHEHPKSHKLIKGLEVKVVGASHKRGFLLVEYGSDVIEVPFHLTELKAAPLSPSRQGIDV